MIRPSLFALAFLQLRAIGCGSPRFCLSILRREIDQDGIESLADDWLINALHHDMLKLSRRW